MGLRSTKLLVFLFLFIPSLCSAAAIEGKEDGTRVGYCKSIDFVGGSQTLTSANLDCTLTSTAGDSVSASGINWTDWTDFIPDANVNWDDMVNLYESDPIVSAISGIVKSDGTTAEAAVAGADYLTDVSAPATVNWIDSDIVANSYNSTWGPAYAQELIIGDAPNQFKVDENGEIYDGTFNWVDLEKISSAGINWGDMDAGELSEFGINWISVQDLIGTGRGGAVYTRQVTIKDASPTKLTDYWQNAYGMTFTIDEILANATASVAGLPLLSCNGDANGGINWIDCNQIEALDITNESYMQGDINWYAADQAQIAAINWATIDDNDHLGVNWTDMTSPTDTKITVRGHLTGAGN